MFAKIALKGTPYAVDRPYSYVIPEWMLNQAIPGMRVFVPFGRANRVTEGIILAVTDQEEPDITCKEVIRIADNKDLTHAEELAKKEKLTLEDLQNETCIIICSNEQKQVESKYYKGILGFKGNFIYARSLEEAKLLVASNKGFLSQCGNLQEKKKEGAIVEIPFYDDDGQVEIKYYAYWKKDISNPIIESFAKILKSNF